MPEERLEAGLVGFGPWCRSPSTAQVRGGVVTLTGGGPCRASGVSRACPTRAGSPCAGRHSMSVSWLGVLVLVAPVGVWTSPKSSSSESASGSRGSGRLSYGSGHSVGSGSLAGSLSAWCTSGSRGDSSSVMVASCSLGSDWLAAASAVSVAAVLHISRRPSRRRPWRRSPRPRVSPGSRAWGSARSLRRTARGGCRSPRRAG